MPDDPHSASGESASAEGHRPTAAEASVLDAIDESWMLTTLEELVAIPSWNGDERRAQEAMAATLDSLGLALDVWLIDETALRLHPDYASELDRAEPLGVVGSVAFGTGGPTLILNGHVDVVPPGKADRWTTPPFSMDVREGRVHGRGVLDMKGPLVAALAGLRAVLAVSPPLSGTVLVQSVIGEEDGGLGTLAAVLRGHTGDGAVVVEPTGMSVAAAQAGALNFRLSVPGQAAHGAVRHEGVSAIENFIALYRDLAEYERERNARITDGRFSGQTAPYPICIGVVAGGDWASSVPDSLTADGRFGVKVGEGVDEVRRAFEARVAACCRADPWMSRHPAGVEWWGGQFAPCETPSTAPVVRATTGAARDLGLGGGRLIGVPYGSDLRHLVNAGNTPGVLFGPGDVRGAHREDESIAVAELVDGARAVALTILRFLA